MIHICRTHHQVEHLRAHVATPTVPIPIMTVPCFTCLVRAFAFALCPVLDLILPLPLLHSCELCSLRLWRCIVVSCWSFVSHGERYGLFRFQVAHDKIHDLHSHLRPSLDVLFSIGQRGSTSKRPSSMSSNVPFVRKNRMGLERAQRALARCALVPQAQLSPGFQVVRTVGSRHVVQAAPLTC